MNDSRHIALASIEDVRRLDQEQETLHILLVEDDPDDAFLVKRFMDAFSGPVEMEQVVRVAAALERLEHNNIDLILLDLGVPDSSGLDTFRRVRHRAPETPIIILTGDDDGLLADDAMKLGAEDYLVKGEIDGHQLTRSVSYAIERVRRRRMEQALHVARDIQLSLYPRGVFEVEGYDFAGRCYPAETVGGDYFDFIHMADGHVGVVVGDVAGHGVGPALLMAETRACLTTLTSLRTLTWVSALVQSEQCPGQILTSANAILARDMPRNRFVTLLMVNIDSRNHTLVHSNAGHPPGYVLDSEGNIKAKLSSNGFPIGIDEDSHYEASEQIRLESGDLIALVSDGVIESISADVEPYGREQMLNVIRHNRHRSSDQILDQLYNDISRHTNGATAADDITMLVIKVE